MPDRVDVAVEWAPGADLTDDVSNWPWADITQYQRQASPISITIGRGDEASTTQPARATLTLNNPGKLFSAYDPASPNWPNVKKGTPFRVTVGGTTRFFGYAAGFGQSTMDVSGKVPVVTVKLAGALRRLIQGNTPLDSPAYRGILATGPVAYLPMEDDDAATRFASGLPGGPAMALAGKWKLAADKDLVGSKPLPTMTETASVHYPVAGTYATGWQIDWHVKLPADTLPNPTAEYVFMRINTRGTIVRWELAAGNNGFEYFAVRGYDSGGTVVVDSGHFQWPTHWHDGWAHPYLTAKQSGSDIAWRLVSFPSLGGNGVVFEGDPATGTWGAPFSVEIPAGDAMNGVGLGHLCAYDAFGFAQPGLPLFGYVNETATARLRRLCAEQGVSIDITGESATRMGPQSIDTFVNLLRECEAADLGVLYDGLGRGLSYVARSARYNAPASLTLDASQGQLAPPFTPTDDDQRARNVWKVSRKGGSSATHEDVDGPLGTAGVTGVYDDSVTLNLAADDPLPHYASWLVHRDTVEGFRYPALALNLWAHPELAAAWLATPLNGRIDAASVDSATAQHPGGDLSLLLEGYTETVGPFVWTVAANVSPFQPWRVIVLSESTGAGGEFACRLGTSGTTLDADADAGATSLSLSVDAGPLWVTDPAQFPLYLNVDGIRVTVTAIAGASSPQTATVDGTTVTKALPAGAPVKVWNPPVLGL